MCLCTHNNKCHCQKVNIINRVKYLGTEICSDMKWKEQINSIRQKIIKIICLMRVSRLLS